MLNFKLDRKLLFCLFVCFFFIFDKYDFLKQGKQANLDRFDGTCGRNDLIYTMTMDSIQFDGRSVYFNYTVNVKENIPDMVLKVCDGL